MTLTTRASGQLIEHGFLIRASHKGLADEDGIDAVVAQDLCVVGRLDAAFGNEENILRHQRPQAAARIEGDREVLEVAVN